MTREGLPTGKGTAGKNDVADPHPSTVGHDDKIQDLGGAKPDIGPNSYAHDGKAPPRSRSQGNRPR